MSFFHFYWLGVKKKTDSHCNGLNINGLRYTTCCELMFWSVFITGISGKIKEGSKKKNKNIVRPGTKPKKDIKTMFAAVAASGSKKKEVRLTPKCVLSS